MLESFVAKLKYEDLSYSGEVFLWKRERRVVKLRNHPYAREYVGLKKRTVGRESMGKNHGMGAVGCNTSYANARW